jgi:Tfp pilus assembly protein PilF
MRGQVTAKVRHGLIPALGVGGNSSEGATRPKNEEAYDLYLRSIALPHDPQPNKDAITMLERAVGLDPNYAPAWEILGVRYHYDGAYGNGGPEAFTRSDAALQRALTLDPNFVAADAWLITNWVERNQLVKAYQQAKALAARHPENALAHFALSYVLRYGGATEESARECDAALAVDPTNFTLRSCLFTFEQLGNYTRGMDFLQLDAGSIWAKSNLSRQYLREGKRQQARDLLNSITDRPLSRGMVECIDDAASAQCKELSQQWVDQILRDPDAEVHYVVAPDMMASQKPDLAMRLLKSSVGGHYCAYTGLQNEPAFAKLRGTPEFTALVAEAKKCRDDFMAARDKSQ